MTPTLQKMLPKWPPPVTGPPGFSCDPPGSFVSRPLHSAAVVGSESFWPQASDPSSSFPPTPSILALPGGEINQPLHCSWIKSGNKK